MSFPFGQHIQSSDKNYISTVLKNGDGFTLQANTPYYIESNTLKADFTFNGKIVTQNFYPGAIFTPVDAGILKGDNIKKVSQINNVIPKPVSKIGVQAGSGQIFCLNGNGLKINDSGIFEYIGQVDFIGFVPGTSQEIFILDYKE